jgi:hypothetical protein
MEQLDPTWMPFIRTDRYGEGGWVISFWAKARLLLLACTLLPLRLIAALSCVASFYITCRLAGLIPNDIVSRRIVTACGKVWSRACLFCLGFIYIRWTRLDEAAAKQPKRRSGMDNELPYCWLLLLLEDHITDTSRAWATSRRAKGQPVLSSAAAEPQKHTET